MVKKNGLKISFAALSLSLSTSSKMNCASKHCNGRPQSTFVSSEMCVVWEENAVAIRNTSTVYGMQSNQSAHKCNLCCRPSHSYTVNENICSSIMCKIDSVLQLLVLLSRRFFFSSTLHSAVRFEWYVCMCMFELLKFQTKWFWTTTAFTWLVNYIERLSKTFYFSAQSFNSEKTVLTVSSSDSTQFFLLLLRDNQVDSHTVNDNLTKIYCILSYTFCKLWKYIFVITITTTTGKIKKKSFYLQNCLYFSALNIYFL